VRTRGLLWLIALLAFAFPPLTAVAGAAIHHATVASTDCPDHPPPPDPCPAKGTAEHAAGDCCPMMTGTLALLPDNVAARHETGLHGRALSAGGQLSGLLFTKDPPPPRV
jgi:hypothetical protein